MTPPRAPLPTQVCPVCGHPFPPRRGGHDICTRACRAAARKIRRTGHVLSRGAPPRALTAFTYNPQLLAECRVELERRLGIEADARTATKARGQAHRARRTHVAAA
jgi:hypothetical protein